MQQLGQLKALSSLGLLGCEVEASVQQLAAALVSLHCLQSVCLGWLDFNVGIGGDGEGSDASDGLVQEEGNYLALIGALAGLPALGDVLLSGVWFGGGDLALKLGTVTQLT